MFQGTLLTPRGVLSRHILEIRQGRIARIAPARAYDTKIPRREISEGVLVPGFVDLQVNPVGDCDPAEQGEEAIPRLARRLAAAGCTSFLAALVSTDNPTLQKSLRAIVPWVDKETGGAKLVGVHLEGPFLNPLRRGVHPLRALQRPHAKRVSEILAMAGASLKMMTIAPELPGGLALVKRLCKEGILASIGHSNATYEETKKSFDAGIRTATHLFNASSPFHHRAPGVVGAVLDEPGIRAQIIADGRHVHSAAVELVYRIKGRSGLALVTDILVGGYKRFSFAGQKIELKAGRFQTARGTVAGASCSMVEGLRCLRRFTGAPLEDLIECTGLVPAALLGLQGHLGSLEVGKQADMVWLDAKGRVAATWVGGRQVYVRDHRIHRQ